jgi:hypothetical protein
MRLATRFKLMGLLSAAIVAITVAILLTSAQRVQQELLRNEAASDMVGAITGLRFLTMEYVLKHEERTRTQWRMRSASLAQLLAQLSADASQGGYPGDGAVLAGLQITLGSIDKQFARLSEPRPYARDATEQAVAAEFEARLSGQITNRMQGMIADAMRLSALAGFLPRPLGAPRPPPRRCAGGAAAGAGRDAGLRRPGHADGGGGRLAGVPQRGACAAAPARRHPAGGRGRPGVPP